MNPAFLIHMATAYSMATAYIKATAKGHEANSISYLVLEIKRNLCLFCVWFSDQLISRTWLKAPFVYHCIIHDRVKQKNLSRPLTGLSTRQSTRDNPSSNHPQWHIGFSPELIQGPTQRPLLPQGTSSLRG